MNLPLNNLIKIHENTKKTAKSMPNQQNPNEYKQIDIQKIIPNPSKSRNPKFGKIANYKRTNLRSGAAASALETTCAAGGAPVLRGEKEMEWV